PRRGLRATESAIVAAGGRSIRRARRAAGGMGWHARRGRGLPEELSGLAWRVLAPTPAVVCRPHGLSDGTPAARHDCASARVGGALGVRHGRHSCSALLVRQCVEPLDHGLLYAATHSEPVHYP